MIKNEIEVMNLYEQGARSALEIATTLNIKGNRVWDVLIKNGIYQKEFDERNKLKITSKLQEEVLIGTVIGDGCLCKQNKTAKKCRISLAHSLKQRQYFLKKYEILKDLIETEYRIGFQHDTRTNKDYHFIKFQSKANLLYADLRDKWYKNDKKIIPKDIYKYGADCLAVKFYDDGYKSQNGFYIAMDRFDEESLDNFIGWIMTMGIESTLEKGNRVYIPKRCKEKFVSIVKPFATSDVLYKLGELLENPEVDNQQPSCGNPIEVPQKVQRLTSEDGNQ